MNRIAELRKKNGLTLKELSNELSKHGSKISADSLAKYERGERNPKIDKWQALADFFNVSVPYLQRIDKEVYSLKFPSKEEGMDFIHQIMKAQNITLEDIKDESNLG